MDIINASSVVFDPASLMDPFGKVFYYRNDVYRAIQPESVALCTTILKRAAKWEKYGLVKTRKSALSLGAYPLTVWHKKIAYKNYCMEWLPEMFQDAACVFLKLNLKLLNDGFVCKDAHPWNMFFDYSKPVFIDIGSIVPVSDAAFRASMSEFFLYFLLPLILFEKQGFEKTNEFLRLPIPNTEYRKTIAPSITDSDVLRALDFSKPKQVLKTLIRYISEINVASASPTQWSNYDQKEISFKRPHRFIAKQRAVYDFLLTCREGDLLDIGCNSGWYSLLSERMGHRVVGIDNDIPSISRLYKTAKKKGLKILTLYNDFKNPTPKHGLNNVYPSFEERYSFDMVLAMAVVHHLAYSARMTFDEIAGRISGLTKKHAVVEFIPREDLHVRQWNQTGMECYTREDFIESFLRYFKEYCVVKSSPNPREVFIFTKK